MNIKKTVSRLRQNEFMQAVAILMSGTFISQFAVVLATPILTRLYDPAQFGVYAIYSSILLTISIMTSLHYETAIPLPRKDKDAFLVLLVSLMILACSIFLFIVITFLFGKRISIYFGYEELANYIYLLPFGMLGLGLFQNFQLWALRGETYKRIAKGKMQMNFTQISTQIGFGLFSNSTGFIIGGDVIGRLAGGISLAQSSKREFKPYFNNINLTNIKQTASQYKHFPLYSSWSSLFHALGTHLPTLFIANVLDLRIAGLYLIAARILALPDALIGYSVKQVYFSKSVKLLHDSFDKFNALFKETMKRLILLSFLIFLVISIIAPYVFPFILGNEWNDAGLYVQCLSILFFFQLVTGPISANLNILELLHLQVIAEGLCLLSIICGMIIAYYFLTVPWQIILCISISGAIGCAIVCIISWYAMHVYQRRTSVINYCKKQTL